MKPKHCVITKEDAIARAIRALKAWGKYGEEMRQHGLGADCSSFATGYSNEYLIKMLDYSRKFGA